MAPAKQKPQKMSLGDFLGNQPGGGSWADEMEDMPVSYTRTGYGTERRAFTSAGGYSMDRSYSDRGTDRFGYQSRDQLPLPTKPPFTAHLGNLPFDATEGDIGDFFSSCSVTNVRIVEDKFEHKPKGFGYIEFATLDGLKAALNLNGGQFSGRSIRVSVAEPPKDRQDAREIGDWVRKGPLPDIQGQRRASERGNFRTFDSQSDAGGERRRPPPFEGDGKTRNFDTWERKGPLSPLPSAAPFREGSRVRSGLNGTDERRTPPSMGEGRSADGPRQPGRQDMSDNQQGDRQPTAPELDSQWRTRMRPAPAAKSPVSTPETSTPSSPGGQSAAPIGRPKLNLTKRTVSEADPAASAAAGETKASPFGAARPIDTAAKEKEIAEKRQLAVRVKKEQDDKAKEERHAREAAKGAAKEAAKGAAKEPAKGGAKDPAKPDAPTKSADAQDKNENAPTDTKADSPGVTRSYEILQKARDDDASTENSYVDISANGTAGEDNASSEATTPPATVKDENEGSAKQQKADAPTGDGAGPQNEESGWSTVAAKSKNNRRGGASSARTAAT